MLNTNEDPVVSDFFHTSSVVADGYFVPLCEHGFMDFACYSAACRPPTSGGTGGSTPGGKSGVEHTPSEFGKRIRDAIDAEPSLRNRKTFSELKAAHAASRGATKLTDIDSEMTDFGFEAAATRVGKLVLAEVQSRVAHIEARLMGKRTELALELQSKLGIDIDQIVMYPHVNGGYAVREKSGHPQLTPEQRFQVAEIAKKYELPNIDLQYFAQNVRTRATQQAYLAVMREIQPMGGTLGGTPRHRATRNGLSSKEQVTDAAARYPSSWIELSNLRGAITFKRTESRAHYNDFMSEITLDGKTSTAIHEIGHRMEKSVPGLFDMEVAFFLRRTEGQDVVRIPGYKPHEIGVPDGFYEAYCGKIYKHDSFELVSMGMEAISFGKTGNVVDSSGRLVGRRPIDDDYAAFLYGALVTLVKPE